MRSFIEEALDSMGMAEVPADGWRSKEVLINNRPWLLRSSLVGSCREG